MDNLMRNYCIEKYDKILNDEGIDTVCFMGYGYDIEDIKVGAEFYIPYLFYCRDSDYKREINFNNLSEKEAFDKTLQNCLKYCEKTILKFGLTDKYKLISKFKYFQNTIFKGIRQREEHVVIKNLRTKEVFKLSDDYINQFNKFYFVTW